MIGPSSEIGSYVIEREIGRGGMGVVYLAQDTRLGRAVAIKGLPEELAGDRERLARFEREARTLASLSHPNLAGIYGVEEREGRRYLVLEYVEGESLADRLDRGALGVDEALEVCAQIAAGVEAAHEAGVIHRDLKPGNVTLTPDGKVKVLDFGLAKEEGDRSSTGSGSGESPTMTSPAARQAATMEGAVIGTPAYMSPEQARGRRVDRRTDVWSFGCILYECLTGRSPFLGETPTDTMGAILHKEVEWGALPAETPSRVRELLSRMLQRDRERRLRSLGDAMLELEASRGEPEAGFSASGARAGRRGGAGLIGAGALLGIVVGAAGVAGVLGARGGGVIGGPEGSALSVRRVVQVTDFEGIEAWGSLSPDGSTVVYASDRDGDFDIYSQRVGGSRAINLTSESAAQEVSPVFSPDGQSIVFRSERDGGGLFVMGATGESPRRLTDFGFDPAWSPDGRSIVFATEMIVDPGSRGSVSSMWTLDLETGETTQIHEGDAVQPHWSPSGERIAYWRIWDQGGQRDLFTMRADGSEVTQLTSDGPLDWNPVWSPDGRFIYFGSDRGGSEDIWRMRVDESSGEALGSPEPVTMSAGSENGLISLSADGVRLVFSSSGSRSNIVRLDLDAESGRVVSAPTSITRQTTEAGQPSISPDGSMIAYVSDASQEELAVIGVDGEGRRLLTNDPAKDRGPVWGADGETLYFYSDRGGSYAVWRVDLDGGGLRQFIDPSLGTILPRISASGDVMTVMDRENRATLVRLSGEGVTGESLPRLDGSPAFPICFSPDGSRLLATTIGAELRARGLHEIDLATGESRVVFEGMVAHAEYLSDGERALVSGPDLGLALLDLGSLEVRAVVGSDGEPIRLGGISGVFDLAADDSWLCFQSFERSSDLWMIEFERAVE